MVGLKALTFTKTASCYIRPCASASHHLESFLHYTLHPAPSQCLMEEQACPSAQSHTANVRSLLSHIWRQQTTLDTNVSFCPCCAGCMFNKTMWLLDDSKSAVALVCASWLLNCVAYVLSTVRTEWHIHTCSVSAGLFQVPHSLSLSILECLFLCSHFVFFILLVRGQSILSSFTKKATNKT